MHVRKQGAGKERSVLLLAPSLLLLAPLLLCVRTPKLGAHWSRRAGGAPLHTLRAPLHTLRSPPHCGLLRLRLPATRT